MGRCSRRRCSGAFKESWPRSRYACTRKGIAGDHAGELGRGEERKEGGGKALTGGPGLSDTERGSGDALALRVGADMRARMSVAARAERTERSWAEVAKRRAGPEWVLARWAEWREKGFLRFGFRPD